MHDILKHFAIKLTLKLSREARRTICFWLPKARHFEGQDLLEDAVARSFEGQDLLTDAIARCAEGQDLLQEAIARRLEGQDLMP